MTAALRKTVADTKAFCAWAASAPPRDFVIYHVGNLGLDRANSPALHELAEVVLLLQETGYLIGGKYEMPLAAFNGWGYIATRSGGGWAPKSVIRGQVTASKYRALTALRDRDIYQSAARVIRDAATVSEARAADILAEFLAFGLVEEAPSKGWQLSPAGLALLT